MLVVLGTVSGAGHSYVSLTGVSGAGQCYSYVNGAGHMLLGLEC